MVPAAVLLDAMGTLVRLEPPWPNLVQALDRRGVEVDEANARAAMLAEIAYYREHHDEGSTPAGVQTLRRRCAAVLAGALGEEVLGSLGDEDVHDAMLEALVFRAYAEVPEVLTGLRSLGCRLVVVSNWDLSLLEVLEQTNLAGLLDGVVISAQEGVAKPDPRIFAKALEVAGAGAGEAIHAGDSLEADVGGARAAGIRAVLIDRERAGRQAIEDVTVLEDLRGLLAL